MIRKLVNNRVLIASILFILSLGATIAIIRMSTDIDPTINVYVFKENYEREENLGPISETMLSTRSVAINQIPDNAIKDKTKIVGKYLKQDAYKDQFVVQDMLRYDSSENDSTLPSPGKAMVTIAFDTADSADAWLLKTNEKIQLLYVPKSFEFEEEEASSLSKIYYSTRLIEASIMDIKDQDLLSISQGNYDSKNPVYITFELATEEAEFVLTGKSQGHFEIYKTR